MSQTVTRSAGRPRRLTLEMVLDEALAMGVENIEMAPLAKRLGVAVGTLYTYVHGREHLIFQIASRQSQWAEVKDRGQPWPDIIREHAQLSFDRLRNWPQLIANMVTGSAGAHFGVETRRHVVGLLTSRGLSVEIASQIYFETNQAILGAVVVAQYMDSTLSPLCEGRTPAEAFGIPESFGSYEAALERLVASFEQHEKAARRD